MATFNGTANNDTITPTLVSAGVTRNPAGSFPSAAADVIDGGAGDDSLDGGAGSDSIFGGAGNDTVRAGIGTDSIDGGDGIDSLVVDYGSNVNFLVETWSATSFNGVVATFSGSAYETYGGVEAVQVTGGAGADQFYVLGGGRTIGAGGVLSIDGRGGVDYFHADVRFLENTTFVVGSGGVISSNLGNFANLEQFGIELGVGANTVTTGSRDDGSWSYGGIDTINGGGGLDFWGGVYHSETTPLSFTWNAASGAGTLSNGVNLTGIEQVYLGVSGGAPVTATINGNLSRPSASNIVTSSGNDVFTVRAGHVAIDAGGTGAGDMDRLTLDFSRDSSDDIVQLFDDGSGGLYGSYDAFDPSNTFTPSAFYGIERVTVLGGSGNDVFEGASGADSFVGGAGDDSLLGAGGADSLTGGAGTDTLIGGLGNDTYTVDGTADTIIENAGEGTDLVRSSVSFSLAPIASVENLTLTGTAAIGGTGNGLANVITGNGTGNLLSGLAGNDSLIGGTGNDTLLGGAGSDSLDGGVGADVFQFQGVNGNDVISGFSDTGGTADDRIRLLGYGPALDSFADLNITYAAGNATINLSADVPGAGVIALIGITSGLDATDFLFV